MPVYLDRFTGARAESIIQGMENAHPTYSPKEAIWLCGRPRFLRETLGLVLKETFSTVAIHEILELEPPSLPLPENACWLIWFLNGQVEIRTALEKIAVAPAQLNLLLIQSDGHALVRRVNQAEEDRIDISLNELTFILKSSLTERQAPKPSGSGGTDVTYWQ